MAISLMTDISDTNCFKFNWFDTRDSWLIPWNKNLKPPNWKFNRENDFSRKMYSIDRNVLRWIKTYCDGSKCTAMDRNIWNRSEIYKLGSIDMVMYSSYSGWINPPMHRLFQVFGSHSSHKNTLFLAKTVYQKLFTTNFKWWRKTTIDLKCSW